MTVGSSFDWQPGDIVEVVLSDGQTPAARVVASRTTRPGPVESGQEIRLALEPLGGEITQVELTDGTKIVIRDG